MIFLWLLLWLPLKTKTRKSLYFQWFRAGDERIELPPKVLETPIIPFDQSPTKYIIHTFKTTYMLTFPWELTSCVADWVLYSAGVTSWLCHSVSFASQMFSDHHECLSTSKLAPIHSCCSLPALSAFWSSPHPISNSQLHALLHFHLCRIYLVVFKGVYFLTNGISHLKGGFTLRCLQRLSLPGLATRP